MGIEKKKKKKNYRTLWAVGCKIFSSWFEWTAKTFPVKSNLTLSPSLVLNNARYLIFYRFSGGYVMSKKKYFPVRIALKAPVPILRLPYPTRHISSLPSNMQCCFIKGILCNFIWSYLCQISPGGCICTSHMYNCMTCSIDTKQ